MGGYTDKGKGGDMHTTLDLSQYNDVTAYADAVHRPVVHVDYLPTPQAVARRVREAVDDRHLSNGAAGEGCACQHSGCVLAAR